MKSSASSTRPQLLPSSSSALLCMRVFACSWHLSPLCTCVHWNTSFTRSHWNIFPFFVSWQKCLPESWPRVKSNRLKLSRLSFWHDVKIGTNPQCAKGPVLSYLIMEQLQPFYPLKRFHCVIWPITLVRGFVFARIALIKYAGKNPWKKHATKYVTEHKIQLCRKFLTFLF